MIVMGIDMGGATRNGIAIMGDHDKLLYHCSVPYNKKLGKGHHRRQLSKRISSLVEEFNVNLVLVERIKQFKGKEKGGEKGTNISKMTNMSPLIKLTGAIIDAASQNRSVRVFEVEVRSWKSSVLGDTSSDKEPAINFVKLVYKIEVPHDEADSICIACYGSRNYINMPGVGTKEITDD